MIDDKIREMFLGGATYLEIGEALGVTRNAVAGRCRKMNLRREGSKQARAVVSRERRRDERDLDILCDLDEGHTMKDCAAHWGVPLEYVKGLADAAA